MAPARRGTSAGEARGGGQSERSRTRRPPRPAHLPKVDGQQALVQGERALDAHDPHEGVCGASVQRPARVLIHQPRLEHLQPKVARARLGRARREAPTASSLIRGSPDTICGAGVLARMAGLRSSALGSIATSATAVITIQMR